MVRWLVVDKMELNLVKAEEMPVGKAEIVGEIDISALAGKNGL